MRFRFSLFILCVLMSAFVFLSTGCGKKNKLENYRFKKVKEGNFELSIGVPKGKFRAGKKIPIKVILKNVGREIEFLRYITEQRFDAEVKDPKGKPIWRLSQGQFFAMVLAEEKVKPDETQNYDGTWSQKDAAGNQVAPGKYSVEGKITADEMTKTVTIEIELER